jgi:putative ABC transport system substrate-binding protein
MRRREFITLLGGAPLTAPRATFAQATDRIRRIGVLMPLAVEDPEAKARLGAFLDGLQQLGWTDGRNVRIDARWPGVTPIALANTLPNWLRLSRT